MPNRSLVLLAAGATAVLAAMTPNSGQAAPAGWRCDYTITTLGFGRRRSDQTRTYACYGGNLSSTRRRARYRCSLLAGCLPGACVPVGVVTDTYCER